MKSYSQSREQEVILNYFNGRKGTFLDIGANNGIDLSNTRALAELGWSGCFIEPSPKAFERLKKNYEGMKGFYFYPFAIGDHNGVAILQESASLLSSSDIGLVSTFESSEMQRFKSITTYEPVSVKMFKWKTALNRLRLKEFNFVSIDVESYELHILPHMDLTATDLICLEHNSSEERKKSYLYYTSQYGLDKVIYESAENVIISK